MSDNPNGWIARLEHFIDRQARNRAESIADELDAFLADLVAIGERIEAMQGNLRDWADDDVEKDDRIDARDMAIEDMATLVSELTSLIEEIGVSRAT